MKVRERKGSGGGIPTITHDTRKGWACANCEMITLEFRSGYRPMRCTCGSEEWTHPVTVCIPRTSGVY
jgi:hypothetical protein